jgi:hypothetical protein
LYTAGSPFLGPGFVSLLAKGAASPNPKVEKGLEVPKNFSKIS